jgi:hypothetical protein
MANSYLGADDVHTLLRRRSRRVRTYVLYATLSQLIREALTSGMGR